MSQQLWFALVGRTIIIAIATFTLAGMAIVDEASQPEKIKVPVRMQARYEEVDRGTV